MHSSILLHSVQIIQIVLISRYRKVILVSFGFGNLRKMDRLRSGAIFCYGIHIVIIRYYDHLFCKSSKTDTAYTLGELFFYPCLQIVAIEDIVFDIVDGTIIVCIRSGMSQSRWQSDTGLATLLVSLVAKHYLVIHIVCSLCRAHYIAQQSSTFCITCQCSAVSHSAIALLELFILFVSNHISIDRSAIALICHIKESIIVKKKRWIGRGGLWSKKIGMGFVAVLRHKIDPRAQIM